MTFFDPFMYKDSLIYFSLIKNYFVDLKACFFSFQGSSTIFDNEYVYS